MLFGVFLGFFIGVVSCFYSSSCLVTEEIK